MDLAPAVQSFDDELGELMLEGKNGVIDHGGADLESRSGLR